MNVAPNCTPEWRTTALVADGGVSHRPELLAGDEILATAILDWLLHHSHVLNIRGRSYRLKELEETLSIRS